MEWPSGSGSGASRDTKGDPPGTCNIVIEKWEGSPEARERFKTHFKIRDVTKFEKVLNRFCERQKLDVETQHLAISLDGEHIDGAASARVWDMFLTNYKSFLRTGDDAAVDALAAGVAASSV